MEKNLEKEVSDCCGVAFHVEGSDEGTNHYECNKCHQSCDTVIRPAPSQPSMEVSDCCGASYQVSKSTRKGTRIFCNECGEECTNLKSAPKKEKESTEVRY
jgi:Golgi nucleoside diphosphatase